MTANHTYDAGFYDYIADGSRRSARVVIDGLIAALRRAPGDVLDVGCGQGEWTRAFLETDGVENAIGVDGDYVDRARLRIAEDAFIARDLAEPFDLRKKFDLAISLEVAEHLPAERADDFIASLARHSDIIMFSAATPGQGGEHHVNEQPLDYWRRKFAAHGFAAFDAIRPQILDHEVVEPWYRYNTLLYVRNAVAGELPKATRDTRIPDEATIPDLAPLSWRLRCAMLRALPRPMIEQLASVKHFATRAARSKSAA